MNKAPELKRIADSLENIEKIVTRYCTVQSMPSLTIKHSNSLPDDQKRILKKMFKKGRA